MQHIFDVWIFSGIVGAVCGWCGGHAHSHKDYVGLGLCVLLFLANLAHS